MHWKDCEREINIIKRKYELENSEIHIAWILRPYVEQNQIANFKNLDYSQRKSQVERLRRVEFLKLQKTGNRKSYEQTKKNYRKTIDYIHLSFDERKTLIKEIAICISRWGYARLFAECIDKIFYDPTKFVKTIDEQAFEQIISRFEQYLQNMSKTTQCYGLVIYDHNPTVAKKHTELMKKFHKSGTLWTRITNIIETPLFVDSQLTSMIQVADVCAYSLRRYLENREEELFDWIFQRADRIENTVVGIRHFSEPDCSCKICDAHKKSRSLVVAP